MSSLIEEPNTDFHLKLNQQSFYIPYELLQKNIRQVYKLVEKETKAIQRSYDLLNRHFERNSIDDDKIALGEISDLIKRIDKFEKQLSIRIDHDLELLDRIKARLDFFQDLDDIKASSNKNRLLLWYQKYTNLLIGDYLLRNSRINTTELESKVLLGENRKIGNGKGNINKTEMNSGDIFLKQQHLEQLLDHDILITANKISNALTQSHDLTPLLKWINENKIYLKKRNSILEFETRFQEYIELLKQGWYQRSISCYQTYLLPFMKNNFNDLKLAAGLILFIQYSNNGREDTATLYEIDDNSKMNKPSQNLIHSIYENIFNKRILTTNVNTDLIKNNSMHFCYGTCDTDRYQKLLSVSRWDTLKKIFLDEYYTMYGISKNDPLLIYLSLGISTLKTKGCLHESIAPDLENGELRTYLSEKVITNHCPVCSESFAKISKNLPYAHHTKSRLFENPVMLPNGNVYDAQRLKDLAKTLKKKELCILEKEQIIDPIDGKRYSETDFVKMYPT
ncbi:glucose-induced degradation complex subunit FYV10 NDAI_0B03580 [Naumovozyma dairenensis CBS 421]|uniref:Uncharacterized protein n=1 Tax=Naumovozyma dairenensis (strain ATCC 10597 / BCRC 20456 / CBS 421 / NBRC 0211 / NRRL Y-12639) TaxID=1071378 RepID=G0W6I1_NAUDC|nr:hypothetical protein NDAI_0B03580 [Naumovozyma dairenensis CBS 421]CCD23392.1 hypothetical protein NDAI_0B03580 [Naumovozyma dairenensis CBS 421]